MGGRLIKESITSQGEVGHEWKRGFLLKMESFLSFFFFLNKYVVKYTHIGKVAKENAVKRMDPRAPDTLDHTQVSHPPYHKPGTQHRLPLFVCFIPS